MGTNASRFRAGGVVGGAEPGAGLPGFYSGKYDAQGRAVFGGGLGGVSGVAPKLGPGGPGGFGQAGPGGFDPNAAVGAMAQAAGAAGIAGDYLDNLQTGYEGAKSKTGLAKAGAYLNLLGAAGRKTLVQHPDIVKYAAGETAYGEAMGVFGGGGDENTFFGGAPADPVADLAGYEASRASRAKVAVVRRIARALQASGVEVDPEGDVDEIVRKLAKTLPNPRTNGRTFDADAARQEKVCRTVARALNDVFTPGAKTAADKFVDDAAGAVGVCHAISDWVESFNAGVNAEFTAVHTAVREALRGLALATAAMDRAYGEMRAPLAAAADESGAPEARVRLAALDDVYTRARAESRRQTALLEKALNVDLPSGEEILRAAMRDGAADAAAVKRMGLNVGTADFGSALASAVSGLGTAAAVAARVDKALKAVGLAAADYVNARSYREFEELVTKLEANTSGPEFVDFLKQVGILRSAFSRRAEIRADLGVGEAAGARVGGAVDDDDPNAPPKSAFEKADRKRKTEAVIVVSDFVKRLPRVSDAIFEAVERVAACVGDSIPTGEKVDALVESLARLANASKPRKDLVLLQADRAASARLQRDEYLRKVRQVGAVAAALAATVSGAGQGALLALEEACKAFEEVANRSAAALAAVVGDAKAVIPPEEAKKIMAQTTGGVNSLARANLTIVHAARVGRMKAALASAAASIPEFSANYKEVLGEAAGWESSRVNLTAKPAETILSAVIEVAEGFVYDKDAAAAAAGTERHVFTQYVAPAAAPAAAPAIISDAEFVVKNTVLTDDEKNKAKTMLSGVIKRYGVDLGNANALNRSITVAEGGKLVKALKATKTRVLEEKNAKLGLIKAAQAVDLYLASFSSAVAANPDDVRDIKKMLDETAVVAQWFTGETAKSLSAAFESIGAFDPTTGAPIPAQVGAVNASADSPFKDDHYYAGFTAAAVFGHPCAKKYIGHEGNAAVQAALDSSHFDYGNTTDHIEKALSTFHALKNLVNAFIRIGDKLGGGELRSSVFMSARQIFDALTKYIQVSAVYVNYSADGVRCGERLTKDHMIVSDIAEPFDYTFRALNDHMSSNLDSLLTETIQAMAGKIMTVVGLFSAMTVVDSGTAIEDTSQATIVRATLGGGLESETQVIEDAAEMYFRLPRLVEFYVEFFDVGFNQLPDVKKRIALVPDFDGTFAKLIKTVFSAAEWRTGQYSQSKTQDIIVAINDIYSKFNGSCGAAANALVAEINRRFGLVKVADLDESKKRIAEGYSAGLSISPGGAPAPQFDILPDEGDSSIPVSAPSDTYSARFMPTGTPAGDRDKKYFNATLADAKLAIEQLRDRITSTLTPNATPVSLTKYIKGIAFEMKHSSAARRYELAATLVSGNSVAGAANATAAAFHETVVLGLNVLMSVSNVLDRFNDLVAWVDRCCNTGNFGKSIKLTNPAAAVAAAFENIPDAAAKLAKTRIADPVSVLVLQYNTVVNTNAAPGTFPIGNIANQSGIPFRKLIGPATDTATPMELARSVVDDIPGAPEVLTDRLVVNAFRALHRSAPAPAAGAANPPDARFIDTVLNATNDVGKAYHVLADYLVDRQAVFQRFIDALATMNNESNGLIEHRVTKAGLQVSLSRLRDTVKSIFADIEKFLGVFESRGDGLRKLAETLRGDDTVPEAGTLNWLRLNLVEAYFPDSVDNLSQVGDKSKLPDRAKSAWDHLTNRWKVSDGFAAELVTYSTRVGGVLVGGGAVRAYNNGAARGGNELHRWTYSANISDAAFSGMIAACMDAKSVMSFGPAVCSITHYNYSQGLDALAYQPAGETLPSLSQVMRFVSPTYNIGGEVVRILRTSGQFDVPGAPAVAAPAPAANEPASVVKGLYSPNKLEKPRSIMFAFNQIVAHYIATLLENGPAGRIYLGLLSPFANTPGVSPAMNDPEGLAWPDLAANCVNIPEDTFIMGGPRPGVIITMSNAVVLTRIMREVTKQLTPTRLYTTLADVPSYMKEKYRAALPRLIAMIDAIVAKCDYMRKLLTNALIAPSHSPLAVATSITAGRAGTARSVAAAAIPLNLLNPLRAVAAVPNPANYNFDTVKTNLKNSEATSFFTGLVDQPNIPTKSIWPLGRDADASSTRAELIEFLTNIASAASALSAGALSTLKELGDTPPFLSLSGSFRETYTSQNGTNPIAFASASFPLIAPPVAPAANDDPIDWSMVKVDMTPQEVKYSYGLAGIISASPIQPEHLAPVASVIDMYNDTAGPQAIETGTYLEFATRAVGLVRELALAGKVRALLASSNKSVLLGNPFGGSVEVGTPDAAAPNGLSARGVKSHLFTPAVDKIVIPVELTDQDDALKSIAGANLAAAAGGSNMNGTRADQRIVSILDLGVMPINVNALMRDVPLANVYNYAYTFRKFVEYMYKNRTDLSNSAYNVTKIATWNPSAAVQGSTADAFVTMMKDPYTRIPLEFTETAYDSEKFTARPGAPIARILRGDDALGMGRPKFLSDGLYGSALLGDPYQSPALLRDENGAAGDGAKGTLRVVSDIAPLLTGGGALYASILNFQALIAATILRIRTGVAAVMGAPPPGPFVGFNLAWQFVASLHSSGDAPSSLGTFNANAAAAPATAATNNRDPNVLRPNVESLLAQLHASIYGTSATFQAACVAIVNILDNLYAEVPRLQSIYTAVKTITESAAIAIPPEIANFLDAATNSDEVHVVTDLHAFSRIYDGAAPAPLPAASKNLLRVRTVIAAIKYLKQEFRYDRATNSLGGIDYVAIMADAAPAGRPSGGAIWLKVHQMISAIYGLALMVGSVNHTNTNARASRGGLLLDIMDPLTSFISSTQGGDKTLHYYADRTGDYAEVTIPSYQMTRAISHSRFNTYLTRNLFFITNVQRILRAKLNAELSQNRSVVARSHAAIAPALTEYGEYPFRPDQHETSKDWQERDAFIDAR